MRSKQDIDFSRFTLFRDLTPEEMDKFKNVITHRNYQIGDVIIMEGEVGDSIFLLEDGEVEITQAITLHTSESNYDTREKSIIRMRAESYPFFGEMSLFGESMKRTATVTATTDCRMGIISKDDFFRICESDTNIGYTVMKNIAGVLSARLKQCNQNVLKLTTAFSLILEK